MWKKSSSKRKIMPIIPIKNFCKSCDKIKRKEEILSDWTCEVCWYFVNNK